MLSKRKKIIGMLLSILALVAIGLSLLGYSIYKRIENQGGLKTVLEKALTDKTAGITSTIDNTEIGFEFSAAPFRLIASNIRLEASDTALILPSSEFGFSLITLLRGQFVPSDMRMSGLEIEISHGEQGWHAGPSMALITSLMRENAQNVADSDALSSIRNIYIGNAKLVIKKLPTQHHNANSDTIVLSPIAINMQHKSDQIVGSITINNAMGGAVSVNFTGDETGNSVDFTATLNKINMAEIYPYLGVNLPEISQIGDVYGRVSMSVRDRKIIDLSGDLTTDNGETNIPGFGNVAFNNASILFDYDAVVDRLTVTNFDMTTKKTDGDLSGQINFAGELRGLGKPEPLLTGRLRGSRLDLDKLLQLLPNEGRFAFRDQLDSIFSGGRIDALGLDIAGILKRDIKFFEITDLNLVTDLRGIGMEARMASIDNLTGTLGARLELSVGQAGLIKHAKADFILREAILRTKDSARPIDLEGIEIRTQLDGKTLSVDRIAIDAQSLGQLAMVAKVELEDNFKPDRLDLSIKAEQIDKQLFTELWPATISPKSRQWISEQINGGVINGLSLNLGLDLASDLASDLAVDQRKDAASADKSSIKPTVIYLDGVANLANTEVTYIKGMPPITSAQLPMQFQEGFLRADLKAGKVEGIDLAGSRVIIRPNEKGPAVDVALLGNGAFEGAVDLINHPKLDLLAPSGITPDNVSGDIDASVSLKWVIPPTGKTIDDMGGISANVTASIVEANLDGLPGGFGLKKTDMEVILSDRDVSITGRGLIDNASAVMTIDYRHKTDLNIQLALEKSEQATAIINAKSGLSLGGKTGGTVYAYQNAGDPEINVNFDIDLTDTSINLQRFGLVKLPGEAAQFNAQMIVSEGQIKAMGDIDLDSDFLAIKGNANFDESGQFLGAYFDHVAWPGNDISQITIDRNENDVLRISADAKIIDLTPLRKEDSPGEGMSLVVDLTANRIVLDDKVSLAGNVSLVTEKDGRGEATFLGSLFLSGKPFMTESSLKAMFGDGGDLMEGRGLIGGAEASISLSPSEIGGSLMVVRSNNAGQVLKTLNIIDAIRGGKLYMVTEFHPDIENRFETNFELEDFRVIEAPTAVRMMSVLSLAGLYSLVEGDGTQFNLGHARVESREDGRVIIHQARASGDALAVDLVGYLEKESKKIEVSGTLLPLYGITKLIGKVPLISQILTGVDNEGFLVTQFSLTGTIDDPETSVNISSIIPGLFRDVFSPDWINRERQRLIPDETRADPTIVIDRMKAENDNGTAQTAVPSQ